VFHQFLDGGRLQKVRAEFASSHRPKQPYWGIQKTERRFRQFDLGNNLRWMDLAENNVAESVVSDPMTLRALAKQELAGFLRSNLAPEHEKRRLNIVLREDVQNEGRDSRLGPVVER